MVLGLIQHTRSTTLEKRARGIERFKHPARPPPETRQQCSTNLGVEPVGHCRTLEPVQVLRVEDGAPLRFAHEMQQPKVHLVHAGQRKASDKVQCIFSTSKSMPLSGCQRSVSV